MLICRSRDMQAKPTKNAYFGTLGRRLQQGPEDGPPGTIPEGVAYAAETPMSAPGEDTLPGVMLSACFCSSAQ